MVRYAAGMHRGHHHGRSRCSRYRKSSGLDGISNDWCGMAMGGEILWRFRLLSLVAVIGPFENESKLY